MCEDEDGQGCTMLPLLFNIFMDVCTREMKA